jgi:hypothetical protein
MSQFRCFCLTADDRIAWGLRVEAANLEAAIKAGERACQLHLETSLPRVEIWRGANKLYTSPVILDSQDYRTMLAQLRPEPTVFVDASGA